MVLDTAVSVLVALPGYITGYMGLRLGMAPPPHSKKIKLRYKIGFLACALTSTILIIYQGYRTEAAQTAVERTKEEEMRMFSIAIGAIPSNLSRHLISEGKAAQMLVALSHAKPEKVAVFYGGSFEGTSLFNQTRLLFTIIGWNMVASIATYPPSNSDTLTIEGSDKDNSVKALRNAFSIAGFPVKAMPKAGGIAGAQIIAHLP